MTEQSRNAPPPQADDIHRILRGSNRDIRDLMLVVHHQQFKVSRTRNNHYKISTPDHFRTKESVFAPYSPSDVRSLERVRAKLRRIGVKL